MKYILYILLNLIIIYHKFDLNILEHVKKKKRETQDKAALAAPLTAAS